MQYWRHCGIGNILPKIVKLPNIHQRLTRQKMRMDSLSSRRGALAKKSASFEIRKNASSRREVIHTHLLAREALMNFRKFGNLRKDIAYPAMSPILHLRFWGNMFSIWCSTCIVRTRVVGVRHWRLQAIGKAPRASMLNTKVSNEKHQQVENWTLFQMQHSFFDVTLKFTVLQRHFHKFCDTPSNINKIIWQCMLDLYFNEKCC